MRNPHCHKQQPLSHTQLKRQRRKEKQKQKCKNKTYLFSNSNANTQSHNKTNSANISDHNQRLYDECRSLAIGQVSDLLQSHLPENPPPETKKPIYVVDPINVPTWIPPEESIDSISRDIEPTNLCKFPSKNCSLLEITNKVKFDNDTKYSCIYPSFLLSDSNTIPYDHSSSHNTNNIIPLHSFHVDKDINYNINKNINYDINNNINIDHKHKSDINYSYNSNYNYNSHSQFHSDNSISHSHSSNHSFHFISNSHFSNDQNISNFDQCSSQYSSFDSPVSHSIYALSSNSKQWPEQTTNTGKSDDKYDKIWYIPTYVKLQNSSKLSQLQIFADTGASISAINEQFARKYFPDCIKTRKKALPIRVANNAVIKLKHYAYIPLYGDDGKIKLYHEFYLIPNLKHQLLGSYYLLQKIQLPFPRFSPLFTSKYKYKLVDTPYSHPEEYDEDFGSNNNWDKSRITTRYKQTDYSDNPTFTPYKNNTKHKLHTIYEDSSYYLPSLPIDTNNDTLVPFDTSSIDPSIYEYEVLNKMTQFDYTSYKPQPIITDPYHNKIKSFNLNNYTSFKNTNLNTLHSIRFDSNSAPIPCDYVSIQDNLCYISNFKASESELRQAANLTQEKRFNKVKLKHLKEISNKLYKKTTKLLYHTFDSIFAKFQSQSRIIPKFEFKIDLKSNAPDRIFIKQYPLSPEKRLVVIHSTQQNIKTGLFVVDNTSIHNVPIIVIPKKPNKYRTAYALQHLNKYTKDVKSYIPTYDYIFEALRGPGRFTTTDLKNYFENIKLRLKDRHLTHVTTPLGGFHLTRASYGFKNIMALAQDIVNYLVRPLNRAVAFVDDIIKKHSPNATPDELYNDIYDLFSRAYEIGLLINPEKTYLFAEEVEYLGYIFNQIGVIPRPEYIQKVLQFHPPTNKKEVQQYLAVLNYISRFLPCLAQYTHVINKLTHKNTNFKWGPTQQRAFDAIQKLVQNVPLLAHPTEEGEFLVQTDASKYAMAAVLYQRQFNKQTNKHDWKIIEFYSKQFDKHLYDHPIMIKECLAITYALNHWQHYLLRKQFFVDTDHRNLLSLYDSDEMKATNMKKKQMFVTMRNAIAQFHFKIAHLKGTQIPLPDYLSREGSVAYRQAPIILRDTSLHPPKFKNKIEEKSLNCLMNYMYSIRTDSIAFPPTITQFIQSDQPSFDRLCMINSIELLDTYDPLKSELVKDRLNFIHPCDHCHTDPLNRWLIEDNNEINNIDINYNNKIYQFNENKNIPIYSTPNTFHYCYSIDELNKLNKLNIDNKNDTSNKTSNKKVTLNISPLFNKPKINIKIGPSPSILKNKLKNIKPSRANKIEYLYNKNIHNFEIDRTNTFDHYINNVLETAFVNRFHNQYIDTKDIDISVNQIESIYNLCEITQTNKTQTQTLLTLQSEKQQNDDKSTNYFTDEFGNRRSQRKRKTVKRFYESFKNEQTQMDNASEQLSNSANNNGKHFVHKTKKQKQREEKELKFKLSPRDTHELFRSLYHDVYQADQIDSILSPTKLQIHQNNDPICQIIIDHITHNIKNNDKRYKYLQRYYNRIYKMLFDDRFYLNNRQLLCVHSIDHDKPNRIFIPTNLIRIALHYIHKSSNFSHPGITQTKNLVQNKFYWYKWQSDCEKYVQQCTQCQEAKGHKFKSRGELAPLVSHKFGDILHLDFLGPFHSALSVLLLTDNYTGYTMLVPTFGQTANDVILAVWNVWRPINGLPLKCVTDRGKGFISELNQRFNKIVGIKSLFTSGYHAQTNAKAERRVQEVKKAIRMINTTLNGEITNKSNKKRAVNMIKLLLPSIQFSINQQPLSFAGISPNMLTRGQNLHDTIDVTSAIKNLAQTSKNKKFKESFEILRAIKKSLTIVRDAFNQHRWYYVTRTIQNFNKNKTTDKFKIDDKVMYYVGERNYPMKKIRSRFTGPFRIIKRVNHNTVTIYNDSTNETMTCHTQKLKLFHDHTFTPENDYLRQLKQRQKLNNEYRRQNSQSRKSL